MSIIYSDSFDFFQEEDTDNLTPEEFLRLTKKDLEMKKEFNIKTYDRVLVRDRGSYIWRIDFFSHIDDNDKDYSFVCAFADYKYIALYEGNEKYLNTNDDIPNSFNSEDIE